MGVDIHRYRRQSYATDINNAGVIVELDALRHNLLADAKRNGNATALGALGKENGAYINSFLQISGYISYDNGPLDAFLWLPQPAYGLPAGMNDLGWGCRRIRLRLDDAGRVIGSGDGKSLCLAGRNADNSERCCRPIRDGPCLGQQESTTRGQIVGTGLYRGQVHGYLLSPYALDAALLPGWRQ